MQFYGKAETAANRIIELFRTPDKLPQALAPIFIRRADNVPCRAWSWSNQILTALSGTDDARGFRQWEQVGRHVKKGARAFHILAPCHIKRKTTDDDGSETDKVVLVGFRSVPVFRYEDTDGAELPDRTADGQFADALPLVDVARAWALNVGTYNGANARHYGYYRHGQSIALGVENLATWAHELVHAADDRCGTIVKQNGQIPSNEIVAELGGAVVLHIIGKPTDADLGGCWDYVQRYEGKHPITACQRLLKRTCAAVALILDTADELQAQPSACACLHADRAESEAA
ncbi:MAG: ArdC-like ssDNA-binding domain-containing protein [Phycisphaerae bacterium]